MLSRVIDNTFWYNLDNRNILREMTLKIGLERIDTQKRIIVEALLDSSVMRFVIRLEFARKQRFKLKKIKRPIYVGNMDGSFNKERPIKHIVKVNIYYQEYRERTEIDMTGEYKWKVILRIL